MQAVQETRPKHSATGVEMSSVVVVISMYSTIPWRSIKQRRKSTLSSEPGSTTGVPPVILRSIFKMTSQIQGGTRCAKWKQTVWCTIVCVRVQASQRLWQRTKDWTPWCRLHNGDICICAAIHSKSRPHRYEDGSISPRSPCCLFAK
jgi:uncharacterized membrane protein